ncbi:MAG: hypothetical protein WB471_01040 [Nocardioides sp.]
MTPLQAAGVTAHGIGGQKDLPISLNLAIAGGIAALVVSFTVLAIAWRSPRYDEQGAGRAAPRLLSSFVTSPAFHVALRVFGMVVFLFAVVTSIFGRESSINPVFGIFFVWLWVGVPAMSVLFGPFWKAISPVRTINVLFARVAGSDPDEGLYRYPERLGYWPAALGLFAYVWFELVFPFTSDLGPLRLWGALYVAAMLIGGALFGNRFYESADPFEVYSSLAAKLSIWGMVDGRLVLRSPLANLATVPVRPGLIGVTGILFGSTGFDSFSESTPWVTYVQSSAVNGQILMNLALVAFCLGAIGIFALGSVLTGVGAEQRRSGLPDAFAHSLVPIVVGYIIAHYLTLLVEIGTRTLIQASDPFSKGWDILGTGSWSEPTWLSYHPSLLASLKVLAVVLGHILAAVAAHDRAIRLLPASSHLTGQLPLLAAMVSFTGGGLYLLFAS